MPRGLQRFHSGGDEHFITCSCYHRQPFLASARRRDLFLTFLEEVRQKSQFVVWGYVVMPAHFHLLIANPPSERSQSPCRFSNSVSPSAVKERRRPPTKYRF